MSDKIFDIKVDRQRLNEKTKRFLVIFIVAIAFFGIGSLTVTGIILSNRNGPHNDLQSIENYSETIINSFEAKVYSTSAGETFYCLYNYDNSYNFSSGTITGYVDYDDQYLTNPEYEIMTIDFFGTGFYFEEITFHVNEKIRLSLAIFADGEIYYTSNYLKKDISLEFNPEVELIELYFF